MREWARRGDLTGTPSSLTAILNAPAHRSTGRVFGARAAAIRAVGAEPEVVRNACLNEGVTLLQEAERLGFRDYALLTTDPDFTPLRATPPFRLWFNAAQTRLGSDAADLPAR